MKSKNVNSIYFIIITLSLLFIACDNTTQKQTQPQNEALIKNDSLLKQKISFPKNEIRLSEKAQDEVEKWMLYAAMEGEIQRMKNYTLDDVIVNAPSILRASDTLLQTIPKKFRTKPIQSRIKVLHTKASVLQQMSNKPQKDFTKLKEVAEEVPVDFFNLNIQLNEVFIEMPELETLER